jgi:electron transfer flavoprotein-quinone oxidoreductase
MKETFDVAIVGAGPAGISAACILADAGVKTIVLERGEYPGAKNMFGGVLYGHNLAQILPDYVERKCPIERNIIENRLWYLSKDAGYGASYRDAIFTGERKYNSFTVGRAKFDRWFAEQAKKKGALVVPSTVVEDVIRDKSGKVVGVKTGRSDGDIEAKVVLLACGVNSPLSVKAGIRREVTPEMVSLAVKETIELPVDVINQRFGVEAGNGVTIDALGDIADGMDGVAILYTNQNSVSLVVGAVLADLVKHKTKPYELIETVKQHPMIAPLIAGGKSLEYIAHWLPEGGYNAMPKLYGNGYLVAGDAGMLFNGLHREGSNMAMASGKMAAETIIEALKKGNLSAQGLSGYRTRMLDSFVMKDMYKYRNFGSFLYEHKELFTSVPKLMSVAGREMLTVNGVSKKKKQAIIMNEINKNTSLWRLGRLLWQGWRSVK